MISERVCCNIRGASARASHAERWLDGAMRGSPPWFEDPVCVEHCPKRGMVCSARHKSRTHALRRRSRDIIGRQNGYKPRHAFYERRELTGTLKGIWASFKHAKCPMKQGT